MASSKGYSGKILKVDLTTGKFETIPTEKYESWGGGHGIGSALFFDLCEDKTVKGTDPKNVVTIMTSRSPARWLLQFPAAARFRASASRPTRSVVHPLQLRRSLLDSAQVRRLGRHRTDGQVAKAGVAQHHQR